MTQDDTVRIFGVNPFVKRIKMGSDESHFNVSLIVRDKVTRQCPQTTTFDEKGEPKRNRTEVPLLPSADDDECAASRPQKP